MTTPRRLRRDQRERTPKMVLRYTGHPMLTREEAMAAKAQFRKAGDVAVIQGPWEVMAPGRIKPLDLMPVTYDEPPSPWVDAAVAVAAILAVLALVVIVALVVSA